MKRTILACLFLLAALGARPASAFWTSASGGQAAAAPAAAPQKEAWPGGEFRAIREILGGRLLFSVAVATAAGSLGMMLVAAGLLPGPVGRAERALRSGRWKVALVGVLSVAVLLLAGVALGNAAKAGARVLAVVGVAVLGFLVWLAAIGLAATAKITGQGLLGDAAGEQSLWRTVGAGGLAIAAAALVPLFGAALFLYFLCRGVGAATIALFARDVGPQPSAAPSAEPAGAAEPPAEQ